MPDRKTRPANSTEQTFERLSRLSDLSMALSSGIDLGGLLKNMARSAREAIKADEVYFMLLDRETFELCFTAFSGSKRKRPTQIRCLDRRTVINSEEEFGFAPCSTESVSNDEVLSAEALLLRNAFSCRQRLLYTGEMHDPLFKDAPFKSAMIIPLTTNTQCVGLMVTGNTTRKNAFNVNNGKIFARSERYKFLSACVNSASTLQ